MRSHRSSTGLVRSMLGRLASRSLISRRSASKSGGMTTAGAGAGLVSALTGGGATEPSLGKGVSGAGVCGASGASGAMAHAFSTNTAAASRRAFTALPYIDLLPDLQEAAGLGVPALEPAHADTMARRDGAQRVALSYHVHRARRTLVRDGRRVHERQLRERGLGLVVHRH